MEQDTRNPKVVESAGAHNEVVCDGCGTEQAQVGGDFFLQRSPSGANRYYCEVCHSQYRGGDALEEELARYLAKWQRAKYMKPKRLLEILDSLATVDEEAFAGMLAGKTITAPYQRIPGLLGYYRDSEAV